MEPAWIPTYVQSKCEVKYVDGKRDWIVSIIMRHRVDQRPDIKVLER